PPRFARSTKSFPGRHSSAKLRGHWLRSEDCFPPPEFGHLPSFLRVICTNRTPSRATPGARYRRAKVTANFRLLKLSAAFVAIDRTRLPDARRTSLVERGFLQSRRAESRSVFLTGAMHPRRNGRLAQNSLGVARMSRSAHRSSGRSHPSAPPTECVRRVVRP